MSRVLTDIAALLGILNKKNSPNGNGATRFRQHGMRISNEGEYEPAMKLQTKDGDDNVAL